MRLIDVHSHIYPRRYIERLKAEGRAPRVVVREGKEYLDIFTNAGGAGQPMTDQFESVQAKLAFMDRYDIAASVLSVGNPWVDFMPAAESVRWASELNEDLEAVCAVSRGRLYGLGILPIRDVAAALAELDRIAALPHLRGAVVSAKPGEGTIDDPAFEPLWAKAAAMNLPLVIHPHFTVGGEDLAGHGPILHLTYGFTFETTLAISRMILSGVLDRHPTLQLIAVHAGGALPFLAGRLDNFSRFASLQRRPSEYLREIYFDAVVYHKAALQCAVDTVGADRLMFGSDHPFGAPDPDQWRTFARELPLDGATAARLFRLSIPG